MRQGTDYIPLDTGLIKLNNLVQVKVATIVEVSGTTVRVPITGLVGDLYGLGGISLHLPGAVASRVLVVVVVAIIIQLFGLMNTKIFSKQILVEFSRSRITCQLVIKR